MTDLTAPQQKVLELTQAGKTPTEIGAEMKISSQGVHGHLRRLRAKRLLPPLEGARSSRPRRSDREFRVADAALAVRESIKEQRAALVAHEAAIHAAIGDHNTAVAGLKAELKEVAKATSQLDELEADLDAKFTPSRKAPATAAA